MRSVLKHMSQAIDIIFLGTASQAPTQTRNVSSAVLRLKDSGNLWMVDCGEGTQHRARRADGVRVARINKIFVTHMHGGASRESKGGEILSIRHPFSPSFLSDHVFGLPGMLCSINNQRGGGDGTPREPVHLVGLEGLSEFVLTSLRMSRTFLGVPLHFTELMGYPELPSGAADGGGGGTFGGFSGRRRRPRSESAQYSRVEEAVLPYSEAPMSPRVSIQRIWPAEDGRWEAHKVRFE